MASAGGTASGLHGNDGRRGAGSDDARQHVVVIGAGYAGLSAALELAQRGYNVTVFEKLAQVGGRAQVVTSPDGRFVFDAGPSWWWMPELYDAVLDRYGLVSQLAMTRLDPAYTVVLPNEATVQVPGSLPQLLDLADELDPGHTLRALFDEASIKYKAAVDEWLWKPMISWTELIDPGLAAAALTSDMLGSFESHVAAHTASPLLRMLLKWPAIFIGASPRDAPALYSLMTYAGHARGTWYPAGGLSAPARELANAATAAGVVIRTNEPVIKLSATESHISSVCTPQQCVSVDGVLAAADYHYVEQELLPQHLRRYTSRYWARRQLSPSCMLFFLGLEEALPGLGHHTFFFDTGLDEHLSQVFDFGQHAAAPTFYVTAAARTAPEGATAPPGGDALFVLVPMAYALNGTDTPALRAAVLEQVLDRMDARTPLASGASIRSVLAYNASYGTSEFELDFHALRGNAFGLANILSQSLVFKPSMTSGARNMVFAGHMTNPGPGVPPSMISGIVAAGVLDEQLSSHSHSTELVNFMLVGAKWVACGAVVLHAAVLAAVLLSTRVASYAHCISLFYRHGRTYFLASTLFDPVRFVDTAAMYALFRVADDCVDVVGASAEAKRAALGKFMAAFWAGLEAGAGEYHEHPVLPAVIETVRRRGYSANLFATFFASMSMDVETKVCETWDETWEYMRGSAAVIGDFMLPLLIPGDDEKAKRARAKALAHARDLGYGFQLTNMIRDIGEDLELGREYVPREECRAHGVTLAARAPDAPGWRGTIETVMAKAEACYASADVGIAMLPGDVRPVVALARAMYSELHPAIRSAEYNVFSGRVVVSGRRKLELAARMVPLLPLLRITLAKTYAAVLCCAVALAEPLAGVAFLAAALSESERWMLPSMVSYAGLHAVVTIPLVCGVWAVAVRRAPTRLLAAGGMWSAALALVAFVYTTPWDNYLVYRQVWGYGGAAAVVGVVGWVPVEEYAFFVLETLLVGGVWVVMASQSDDRGEQRWSGEAVTRRRRLGLGVLAGAWLAGARAASGRGTEYLGLIAVWALPVLALQWAAGAGVLLHEWRVWLPTVATSASALCVIDMWSISHGLWRIAPEASIGELAQDLPVEEALFFVVTSTMCAWGLTLAVDACRRAEARGVALTAVVLEMLMPPTNVSSETMLAAFSHGIAATVVLALWVCGAEISLESQAAALVVTTCAIGLPHGALDPLLVLSGASFTRRAGGMAASWAVYVVLMGAMYAVWEAAPVAALSLFLALSIAHFGEGDAPVGSMCDATWLIHAIEVFARGGAFLVATTTHRAQVAAVFADLVDGQELGMLMTLLSLLRWAHFVAVVGSAARHVQRLETRAAAVGLADLVMLNVLFGTTPPLVGFMVYFNGFHALRHVVRVQTQLAPAILSRSSLGACVVAAIVAGAFVAWQAGGTSLVHGVSGATRGVFVLLSVMATPHMALVACAALQS
ncbi:phytoene desaturase [Thecamonas trahens ATCC 50062]|uniref:Bifunctional lycopene cyclase/phytoene synthase n=1 Tax=Thecamonas trahens ATCC 50062 TaxID=461836 RepID=A0A0L0DT58_THETB|nr:phytoene desaturase [Thecamonas trahens ATCC 50062]KNC54618.1 phytoene desaturase [Thecamonas trahens ATCC 50062]|eukprot:XP_013761525.1 phytoene desaturase [Thecamonas trahens ATCC 50062]